MIATRNGERWLLSVDAEELALIEDALHGLWRTDRDDLAADYTDEFDKAALRRSIEVLDDMRRMVSDFDKSV